MSESTSAGSSLTLLGRLASRSRTDPDFWTFANSGARSGGHALFQYPAMMVPEMQGALLDDVLASQPGIQLLYDPFVGSGTVMLEALYRGVSFHGTDVNPMAILLCQVKSDPPRAAVALAAGTRVAGRARLMERSQTEFFGRHKWFLDEVLDDIERIRSSIRLEADVVVRRFLWICLAETIRLVSNSRTSTVKLHIYAPDVLANRRPSALRTFSDVLKLNADHLKMHWTRMAAAPAGTPEITLLQGSVANPWTKPKLADVIMTSPPYGDNNTTIPYGQHSYLPLQFIDPDDIPGGFDPAVLQSTREIDRRSLGGSLAKAEDSRNGLTQKSPALAGFLRKIAGRPDLEKKVLAFFRDYDEGLGRAFERLSSSGHSLLTLGERRVGGNVVPLVAITRELLEARHQTFITEIVRRLVRKRMAIMNSQGSTMANETVLVMQSSANAVRVDALEAVS